MADFSHLGKLDVKPQETKEYVFEDIVIGKDGEGNDICPSLNCLPMTDNNPAYLNERIRLAVERAEKANKEKPADRRKRILSTDQLEEDRDADRILIARTCAKSWGVGMPDVAGKVHTLDEQTCLDFLRAMPTYMLDPFRGWLSNVYNFVDRTALSEAKADDLGNS